MGSEGEGGQFRHEVLELSGDKISGRKQTQEEFQQLGPH